MVIESKPQLNARLYTQNVIQKDTRDSKMRRIAKVMQTYSTPEDKFVVTSTKRFSVVSSHHTGRYSALY